MLQPLWTREPAVIEEELRWVPVLERCLPLKWAVPAQERVERDTLAAPLPTPLPLRSAAWQEAAPRKAVHLHIQGDKFVSHQLRVPQMYAELYKFALVPAEKVVQRVQRAVSLERSERKRVAPKLLLLERWV